jgi:predicted ester cyclase
LDGIKAVLSGVRAAFPDLTVSVDDMLSDGEFVVVRWTSTGTFTNEILGFAPSGKLISWSGINIFQFACGQCIESWSESDTVTQLGLADDSASPIAATPGPGASPAASCTETSEAGNTEIARELMDIWTTHDISAYDALVDPDVIHHFGVLRDVQGIGAFKTGAQMFFAAFPDMTSTAEQTIADGDLVAVRFTIAGTQTGDFLDVAPTGRIIIWTGIVILRIKCGLVTESWSEVSNIDIRRQLRKLDALATPGACFFEPNLTSWTATEAEPIGAFRVQAFARHGHYATMKRHEDA